MATQPPRPPRKKPFRWGSNDPDHPGLSWWGSWGLRLRPPTPGPLPPAPPPADKPKPPGPPS